MQIKQLFSYNIEFGEQYTQNYTNIYPPPLKNVNIVKLRLLLLIHFKTKSVFLFRDSSTASGHLVTEKFKKHSIVAILNRSSVRKTRTLCILLLSHYVTAPLITRSTDYRLFLSSFSFFLSKGNIIIIK